MRIVNRLCLLGVACLAVCVCWSATSAQPPASAPDAEALSGRVQRAVEPKSGDRLRTVDDVLDALAVLQKQQYELKAKLDAMEKQEKDLKVILQQKIKDLEKRMKELKVDDEPAASPPPPICSY